VIAGFGLLDYLAVGALLAATLGIGFRAGRGLRHSDAFLLASRELSWPALSASLMVMAPAALFVCSAPVEGYWVGLKLLLVPALIWVSLPLVFWCIIPLYHNLDLDSIYEYVELRFDPATRAATSGLYIFWQLLWLGGLTALPAAAMHLGEDLNIAVMVSVIAVGTVATLSIFFGGMRAGAWNGTIQLVVLAAALAVLLGAVVANLDGGFPRIWQVASELNRTKIAGQTFGWSEEWAAVADRGSVFSANWNVWAAALYLGIAAIFFFAADQATVQRFIAARDDQDMSLTYVMGCTGFSLLVPVAMYAGMGLLAVYHDHAQSEIPPRWVVRSAVDAKTGEPLIGPRTPLDAEHLDALLADGAILDPNTGEPLTDHSGLLSPRGELIIDRLATRAARVTGGGERMLRQGGDEVLGRFASRHLPFGLAGLVLAGLTALVLGAVGSGLTALATVVVVDFHRREGYGEAWLARRCDKDPDDLDQSDEMRFSRPLVLVLGGVVTVIGLVVAAWGNPLGFLMASLGVAAGPMAGVFLLGFFTRRTTGPAATAAVWLGMAVALWATLGHHVSGGPLQATWPFPGPLGVFWPMAFGLGATLVVGCAVSLFAGRRKSRQELSGLVAGLGRWGVLQDVGKDELYVVETPGEAEEEGPWR
jgi:Na+/proline symporter